MHVNNSTGTTPSQTSQSASEPTTYAGERGAAGVRNVTVWLPEKVNVTSWDVSNYTKWLEEAVNLEDMPAWYEIGYEAILEKVGELPIHTEGR